MATLSGREEKVLRMLYGIDEEECTPRQLTEYFGVSSTRMNQIGNIALRRLPSRGLRGFSEIPETEFGAIPIDMGIYELITAARNGDAEAVYRALENNFTLGINARVRATGYTALITASRYNNVGVIQFLLKSGADPNARTRTGKTALMWAAQNNRLKAARLLTEYKAKVNEQNDHGDTPLMLTRHMNMAKFLISNGANINAKNIDGKTALDIAIKEGKHKMEDFLKNLEHEEK